MSRVISSTAPFCACPTSGLATLGAFRTAAYATLTVNWLCGCCCPWSGVAPSTRSAVTAAARRIIAIPPVVGPRSPPQTCPCDHGSVRRRRQRSGNHAGKRGSGTIEAIAVLQPAGCSDSEQSRPVGAKYPNGDALPRFATMNDVVPENIRALGPIYFASMLDEMKAFAVADRIVELFETGMLPIGEPRTRALFKARKEAAATFSEAERRAL